MAKPWVSIIIPCYNAAPCIADAIESAINQSYSQKEVIVVDDGSTDESVEIASRCGEPVRVEHVDHRGAAAARNRGLELAKGSLVQFLDADDLLRPEKLERQVAAMEESGVDSVFSDEETMDGTTGRQLNTREWIFDERKAIEFMLRHGISIGPPLHRMEKLRSVCGFREDLPCGQEYDLHLRLACAGVVFRRVPGIMTCVRKMPGSLSANPRNPAMQFRHILPPIYEMLDREGRLDDELARAFAETMLIAARRCIQYGETEEALQHTNVAAKMHTSKGFGIYRQPLRSLVSVLGPMCAERIRNLRNKAKRGRSKL